MISRRVLAGVCIVVFVALCLVSSSDAKLRERECEGVLLIHWPRPMIA
jgi:hypothetical protein